MADDAAIVVSDALDDDARGTLGLSRELRLEKLGNRQRAYLLWHRDRISRIEPKLRANAARLGAFGPDFPNAGWRAPVLWMVSP